MCANFPGNRWCSQAQLLAVYSIQKAAGAVIKQFLKAATHINSFPKTAGFDSINRSSL
jgi:hypothetical protein